MSAYQLWLKAVNHSDIEWIEWIRRGYEMAQQLPADTEVV